MLLLVVLLTSFWIDMHIVFSLTLPVILFVSFPFTCFDLKCHRMLANIRFLMVLFFSLLVVHMLIVFDGYGQLGSILLQNILWSTMVANTTALFLF